MYREPTHTRCAACSRTLAVDEAEIDPEARLVCRRCSARASFDAALVRWRGEARIRTAWQTLGIITVGIPVLVFVVLPVVAIVLYVILGTLFGIAA